MKFIIQKHSVLDIETEIVKDILDTKRKHFNPYVTMDINELKSISISNISDAIPIGSIEFVQTWLKRVHNIDEINPIEIPLVLRKDEFLKRNYKIVHYHELPNSGNFFIKDVSQLKGFSYNGNIAHIYDELESLDKTHLFQVSEMVDIKSEYRVYIINGKIEAISHYDGNPLIFPDVALINKANIIWSLEKDYPKSCTIDIMVTDRGTSIIECHPFISVGLYSTLWGTNLLEAYKDGINYVLKYNTKINGWD